jgi:hypothetical protein
VVALVTLACFVLLFMPLPIRLVSGGGGSGLAEVVAGQAARAQAVELVAVRAQLEAMQRGDAVLVALDGLVFELHDERCTARR